MGTYQSWDLGVYLCNCAVWDTQSKLELLILVSVCEMKGFVMMGKTASLYVVPFGLVLFS